MDNLNSHVAGDDGGGSASNRKMLEAAAKAAGMDYLIWTPGAAPLVPKEHRHAGRVAWHPLTDDGDALRLAVHLRLDICWNQNDGPWEVNAWAQGGAMGSNEDGEGEGRYAAVRRAIVWAAAAQGGMA